MMQRLFIMAFVVPFGTCWMIQAPFCCIGRRGENNVSYRRYDNNWSTDHHAASSNNDKRRRRRTGLFSRTETVVAGVSVDGGEATIAPIASCGDDDDDATSSNSNSNITLFEEFVNFLKAAQESIIQEIESTIEKDSGATFSLDAWGTTNINGDDVHHGSAAAATSSSTPTSGGITRVLQGGHAIEKGACSLTIIRQGVLTAERAANIRARQESSSTVLPKAGDQYSAAALSMVLHSRNPMVPTFRSDVRIFQVTTSREPTESSLSWFGGGADLTPYYLHEPDIRNFHRHYYDLCCRYNNNNNNTFNYYTMKQACDDYFFLPARSEHRGTGGIFFDDVVANNESLAFVQDVAKAWMPSWIPIVQQRNNMDYTEEQKYWQKLRRGRYLEFNLLYDRGVKFGLQTANPRVEGVMVSAPPEIAFAYNHHVAPNSPEAKLLAILQNPINWIS